MMRNFVNALNIPARLAAATSNGQTAYDFSSALPLLKEGQVMTRKHWKNLQAIAYVHPEDQSIEPLFIGITSNNTIIFGVLFTANDILAKDWVVLE